MAPSMAGGFLLEPILYSARRLFGAMLDYGNIKISRHGHGPRRLSWNPWHTLQESSSTAIQMATKSGPIRRWAQLKWLRNQWSDVVLHR